MIEYVWSCDRCGKRLKPSVKLLTESQTVEWNTRPFMFCADCAAVVDLAIVRTRRAMLKEG